MTDDGPQSSEDGSGLHSPVYDAPYPSPHVREFRYQDQVDIQNAAGILHSPFVYSSSLIHPQQPPLIDTTLEVPSAQSDAFPSAFAIQPRNHSGMDYFPNSPANSRFPVSNQSVETGYFKYTERRLPGRPPHDPTTYTRLNTTMSTIPIEAAQRPPPVPSVERSESSTTHPPNNRPRDRREISTVVIACRQCRGRKIRCDSTRPVCNNCVRRSNECEYDAVPKRRGPDKRPGTRQRSCKKRPADGSAPPPPKRKKTDRASDSRDFPLPKSKENMADVKGSPSLSRHSDRSQDAHSVNNQGSHPPGPPTDLRIATDNSFLVKQEQSPATQRYPYGYDQTTYTKSSFPRPIDVNVQLPERTPSKFLQPSSPVLESMHREWWDEFMKTSRYSLSDMKGHVQYLFSDTAHWLEFLHVGRFVETLYDNSRRHTIQPALILAILAMSTLMKSSNAENGEKGREDAVLLRDAAHNLLQNALNSGWMDAALAEAALILSLFESSVHPDYNPDRLASILLQLDNIIRDLSLTSIDTNDPDVSIFPQRSVPIVNLSATEALSHKCSCIPPDAQQPPDPYTSWTYPLPWDDSWTSNQIRDEEHRRVCWSALGLVANYTAQCAAFDRVPPDLFLSDPSNFALLFPGEALDRVSPSYRSASSHSPKESVWALYCRSMLLWNFCNRLTRTAVSQEDKAEYAQEAWNESQFIQDSLDFHVCNLDTALIYLTREYVYDTRLAVTQSLRSLHGLGSPNRVFNRRQAMEWIFYQEQVIRRVTHHIHRITNPHGHQLTRRPYQVTWFSNQLAVCLMLWNNDNSLTKALELAKSVLMLVDVMNYLWPCQLQQSHCDDMRDRLIKACRTVGMELPSPAECSIPTILRSHL
uniref:Zn(2)-C6 fungal-type domain-containing protein n=1 Tax=Moniliophthora roreri TaxID=221103 RepID=A0A0W0G457_MONRR